MAVRSVQAVSSTAVCPGNSAYGALVVEVAITGPVSEDFFSAASPSDTVSSATGSGFFSWVPEESSSGDSTLALGPLGVIGVGGVTDRVGAAAGLNVVAGSVGRAEGRAKFGGSAVVASAIFGVLVARGDVVVDAKGRGIGAVGSRSSGVISSAVEDSAPAADPLSIRFPTSGAGAVSPAGITTTLGACATGACSLITGSAVSLTRAAERVSSANKPF